MFCTAAMCPYCSAMHSVTVFVPSVCLCVAFWCVCVGGGVVVEGAAMRSKHSFQ